MRPLLSLLSLSLCVPVVAQTQFTARTPAAVAATILSEAAAADLDGDGDLDICGGASIFGFTPRQRLLRNDGGERFTDLSVSNLPTLPSGYPSTLKTLPIDIEGDGDIDIAAVGSAISGGSNQMFVNPGRPRWGWPYRRRARLPERRCRRRAAQHGVGVRRHQHIDDAVLGHQIVVRC